MSHRRINGDPHGWIRLDRYISIHESCMDQFKEYLVVEETTEFSTPTRASLVLQGTIRCHGGIVLHAKERLRRNEQQQVRGERYQYHAMIETLPKRDIFRYDNNHVYTREGHADAFHKHTFNPYTGRELKPPEWIGRKRFPVLREVLEELHEWWLTYRDDPQVYPYTHL